MKPNHWLLIVLGVLLGITLCMTLAVGAAMGAGATFLYLDSHPRHAEAPPPFDEDTPRGANPLTPGEPGGPRAFGFTFTNGAEIVNVVPDSPAAAAGLQTGDVILSVDGKTVTPQTPLADLIRAHQPGDEITLQVQSPHETESHPVTVTLGENPQAAGQAYLGVTYRPAIAPQGGIPPEGMPPVSPNDGGIPGQGLPFILPPDLPEGVDGAIVISQVLENTPAAEAGLQPGDLILAVDGDPVAEIQTFVDIMQTHKPGDEVTLTVYRNGNRFDLDVTLAEHPDKPGAGFLGVLAGSFSLKKDSAPSEGAPGFDLPGVPGGDA